MNHRNTKRRLGRSTPQRKALLRNLLTSLVTHGKITTTQAKAREVVSSFDELVATLRNKTERREQIRYAKKTIFGEEAQRILVDTIASKKDRKSGLTRITHLGPRKGDASEMIQIEICS